VGDEPYLAPLPWIVFAVMDRYQGHGVSWAAFGAVVTTVVLLATHRRERNGGARNVLLRGALVWFALMLLAGLLWDRPTDWLADNGRLVSALGFVVIAFTSVFATPVAEFYTRPHVRPSRWNTPSFRRFNMRVTLLWSLGFVIVAVSHVVAVQLGTASGYTMFNWIVPIATLVVVAYRARVEWDRFADDPEAMLEQDSLTAIAFDWDDTNSKSHEH
jgi:hypothetical protein